MVDCIALQIKRTLLHLLSYKFQFIASLSDIVKADDGTCSSVTKKTGLVLTGYSGFSVDTLLRSILWIAHQNRDICSLEGFIYYLMALFTLLSLSNCRPQRQWMNGRAGRRSNKERISAWSFFNIFWNIIKIWRFMHRASSYNMYINQQDAQTSCDWTLFSIRCSTCFGEY